MDKVKELRKKILHEAYVKGIENSFEKLETRLKLKKSTINYVLKKLKEEGYFTKTKYELNLNTLGVGNFAWILLSINWNELNPEIFVKKLLKLTQVVTVADITGENDIAIKIIGSSIVNVSAFILMMEKLFDGAITDTEVYFANKEYKRHYLAVQKKEAFFPNEVDCKILCEKMENPQIKLSEIAKKYNLHRNTVSNRWEKLWKEGVIVKELPDLTQKGYEELKMGLKAFILIKPNPGKENKIINILIKNPEIQDIFTTLSNEIILILRTENSNTLANAHKYLIKTDGSIKRTNTSIFLTKNAKNSLCLSEMKNLMHKVE
jgi:DNA-binding Lrp family transcriptional regulator